MLDWIEQHQGALFLALSFLVGLSGLVLFALGLRLARLLADSLRELKRLRQEENRPYVLFDVLLEGPVVSFLLRNVGRRPALAVSLVFEPDLVARTEGGEAVPTSRLAIRSPIEHLAPDAPFEELVNASSAEFFRLNDERARIDGRIEYADAAGSRYQTPVRMALAPLARRRRLVRRDLDDVAAELERLRAAVEALDQSGRTPGGPGSKMAP